VPEETGTDGRTYIWKERDSYDEPHHNNTAQQNTICYEYRISNVNADGQAGRQTDRRI